MKSQLYNITFVCPNAYGLIKQTHCWWSDNDTFKISKNDYVLILRQVKCWSIFTMSCKFSPL